MKQPSYKLTDEQEDEIYDFLREHEALIHKYSRRLQKKNLCEYYAINSCVVTSLWVAMKFAKDNARTDNREPNWRYWVNVCKDLWRREEKRAPVILIDVWEWIEKNKESERR